MSSISFDRAVDFYDETRGFPPGQEQAVAEGFVKVGELEPSSVVLEVGVGTGRIALPLAGYVASVYGVDISRPMLKRLRQKQIDEAMYVAEGDTTRLPFAASVFDAVMSVHVFHLISNWADAVDEVARVLKPGGILIYAGGGGSPLRDKLYRTKLSYTSCHGVNHIDFADKMLERGWRQGRRYTHRYVDSQTPAEAIAQIRNRIWSSTWSLSDEELAHSVAEAEVVAAEVFDDLHQPVHFEAEFNYQTFIYSR